MRGGIDGGGKPTNRGGARRAIGPKALLSLFWVGAITPKWRYLFVFFGFLVSCLLLGFDRIEDGLQDGGLDLLGGRLNGRVRVLNRHRRVNNHLMVVVWGEGGVNLWLWDAGRGLFTLKALLERSLEPEAKSDA